jgi:transketolase
MKFRSFFESDRLDDYGQNGSIFGEHPPSPSELNGIEAATGSLGHGLPIGIGMALAERYNNKDYRVFVLLGDGECNEGTIWESALFASAKKLNNLITIIDCNRWQATGRTKEIIELAPFQDKWKAFGWDTTVINGHDLEELKISLSEKSTHSQRPLAVIANTIKGKGVSFMEDDNNWHYKIPTTDEVNQALQELKTSTRRVEHEK